MKKTIIPFNEYDKVNEKYETGIENSFSEEVKTVSIRFNIEQDEDEKFLKTISDVIEKYLESNGVYEYSKIKINVS